MEPELQEAPLCAGPDHFAGALTPAVARRAHRAAVVLHLHKAGAVLSNTLDSQVDWLCCWCELGELPSWCALHADARYTLQLRTGAAGFASSIRRCASGSRLRSVRSLLGKTCFDTLLSCNDATAFKKLTGETSSEVASQLLAMGARILLDSIDNDALRDCCSRLLFELPSLTSVAVCAEAEGDATGIVKQPCPRAPSRNVLQRSPEGHSGLPVHFSKQAIQLALKLQTIPATDLQDVGGRVPENIAGSTDVQMQEA